MLHTEWIEDFGFQEVGEGLTRDDRHDHRQQHISYTAIGVLRADGKLQSCQARRPFEYGFVGDAIDVSGPFGDRCCGAEKLPIFRQTRRMVQQMTYGNFRGP
jgi:hypothetical protein